MMTDLPRRVPFRGTQQWQAHVREVVAHLRGGGLIAYATETVYGFGSTLDAAAVARLAALKGRVAEKPFLALVTDPAMVAELGWTPRARALAAAFWPGPLTLLLAAPDGYPPGVRDSRGTVAVRATPHPEARALVAALGAPITSTSANVPGGPPARSAEEAAEVVAALGGSGEIWVLDGGALPPSAPSTIVDCTLEPPAVTRVGALPVRRIRTIVPEIHERNPRRPS